MHSLRRYSRTLFQVWQWVPKVFSQDFVGIKDPWVYETKKEDLYKIP